MSINNVINVPSLDRRKGPTTLISRDITRVDPSYGCCRMLFGFGYEW